MSDLAPSTDSNWPSVLPSHSSVNSLSGSYAVPETYVGELLPGRRIKVIFVGAGPCGITFHYHARSVPYLDYVIYDKNDEVAGTWHVHKYPGLTCDIPSPSYAFLFASNPNWSQFYAPGPEIRQYIVEAARSIGAHDHILLQKKVVDARWYAGQGQWKVVVEDVVTSALTEDWCHVFINGTGILSQWKWPKISGLHSFGGALMHTAAWDSDFCFTGKKVAVIGSGSSGVQVVPALASQVAHLTAFNRSPTYIIPGLLAHLTPTKDGANFTYSEEEREKMRDDPVYCLQKRKEIESSLLRMPRKAFMKDTKEQEFLRKLAVDLMTKRLGGNEELMKKLIPDLYVAGFAVVLRAT